MPAQRIRVWVRHFKDRPNLVLQWIDPATGDRKSQSADTSDPKLAEQRRSDLEADLNAGRWKPKLRGKKAAEGRLTWEAFRKLCEAQYLPECRPCSRRLFRATFRLFEHLAKPRWLDAISVRTVSAFHASLRTARVRGKEGYAPSSIKTVLTYLRASLAWAVEQELLAVVPRFPRVHVPKRKPRPIPAELVERLLDAADDPQVRAFLQCGWLAGMRRSEAFALEWQENRQAPYLDLERERIYFPAEFSKSRREEWVPLDPELRAALEVLPSAAGRTGKVFRFRQLAGGAPLDLSGVGSRVEQLACKAGVKLTMHSLRKGFGSRYAGRVPAQVLQKLMRHANIQLTMDFYANVDDAVEEAVLGKRNKRRNNGRQQARQEQPRSDASPLPGGAPGDDAPPFGERPKL
jgi:integrase